MNYECLWKSSFEKLVERAQKILDAECKDGREYEITVDWNTVSQECLLRVEEGKVAKIPLKVRFTTSDPEDFEEEDRGHGACTMSEDDVLSDVIDAFVEAGYYELQNFNIECDDPTNVTDDICITDEGYIPATYWDPAEGWFETEGAIEFNVNLLFSSCSKLFATYMLAKQWIKQYKELQEWLNKEIFDSRYHMSKIKACIEKLSDIQYHLNHYECSDLLYVTKDGVEHKFKEAHTKHPERGSPFDVNYDHINTLINIIKIDGDITYKPYKEE